MYHFALVAAIVFVVIQTIFSVAQTCSDRLSVTDRLISLGCIFIEIFIIYALCWAW